MSGLNQYKSTRNEDLFVKSVLGHFERQVLTADQEEKLESLYKEKSILKPNKNSCNYFSFAESRPQKAKPRRSRPRVVF